MIEPEFIQELEKAVYRKSAELQDARKVLSDARIKHSGLKIGMIIEDRNGVDFRITNLIGKYSDIEVQGEKRKKDGTFGSGVHWVYGWRLKK